MHALLLFSALPLLLGALLSDWAYASSYQIQWNNFASWLIVGGLVFAGLALVWGAIDYVRAGAGRGRRTGLHLLLLLAAVVLTFINALVHAMDAWAGMPAGLWLSLLALLLLMLASALGWSALRNRVAR